MHCIAHEALLSVEFSRHEYWRGLPFPTPRDPPKPGIELTNLESPALAGGFFTTVPSGHILKKRAIYLFFFFLKIF